jgi:alkylation response protein AidB-like acyl-CoA dehydrogenase
MDLDFTEEQEMLREMVRGLCNDVAGLTVVREMEDDPIGYPATFWQQLADLDLLGLLIPEEYGGSGMTMLEGVVVYEELGRSLAPSPHFPSCVLSAGALLAAGSDEQKNAHLPMIASGGSIVVPAWLEPESGFGPMGVQARWDGDSLSGTKWHVPFAEAASWFLVLARTGDAPTDIGLFLVDRDADGVTLSQQKTIASSTQYAVTFETVSAEPVGDLTGGWSTWHEVMLDGIILLAAQASGGAEHALDITVQYSKDRFQFGKPIGAFQAISHYLADAATRVDGARTVVYEAAWAKATGRDISRLAPMAKLVACDTFRDLTAMAQQVWGGVGFTVEYDIQLYFRRAKQLQITWWDSRYLEDLISASVLDQSA